MDLVSIIIPYYKKRLFIEDTIKSILNQSYKRFEIIIVNDEVTIKVKKLLFKISNLDKRIFVINNNKNLGAGLSRNKGIIKSKGKYIAFCDSDDLWEINKLKIQINFMKNTKTDFSYTSYKIIDKNKKVIGSREARQELKFNQLVKSCDIGLSTVMMKKKLFDNKIFCFPNLKTKEDFVLWLKLSHSGVKMLGIKDNLTLWRRLNNSLSSSSIQKINDGYKVYKDYLGYSRIKSLFFLIILSFNFMLKKIR